MGPRGRRLSLASCDGMMRMFCIGLSRDPLICLHMTGGGFCTP